MAGRPGGERAVALGTVTADRSRCCARGRPVAMLRSRPPRHRAPGCMAGAKGEASGDMVRTHRKTESESTGEAACAHTATRWLLLS